MMLGAGKVLGFGMMLGGGTVLGFGMMLGVGGFRVLDDARGGEVPMDTHPHVIPPTICVLSL